MTTIAEKIAALDTLSDVYGFVDANIATQHGFSVGDDENREKYGQVAAFNIAMQLRGRVTLVDGIPVPNIVDCRGQHFELADGSWIMFENGCNAQVSDGKVDDSIDCDSE